uniref:Putative secreted protein n=1 Tax=Anopheles darlingi TaxID=43151 RepID=A0A2M4D9N9_ANODA
MAYRVAAAAVVAGWRDVAAAVVPVHADDVANVAGEAVDWGCTAVAFAAAEDGVVVVVDDDDANGGACAGSRTFVAFANGPGVVHDDALKCHDPWRNDANEVSVAVAAGIDGVDQPKGEHGALGNIVAADDAAVAVAAAGGDGGDVD